MTAAGIPPAKQPFNQYPERDPRDIRIDATESWWAYPAVQATYPTFARRAAAELPRMRPHAYMVGMGLNLS